MERLKLSICIACMLIATAHVNGQNSLDIAALFENGSHTYKHTTLPYRIFIPDDYNPGKEYPIVFCLHGAGERGVDNERHIWKHDLAISWAKSGVQDENPCFVLAPQCPKGKKWNYVNFRAGSYFIDTLPVGNELLTAIDLLDSIIIAYSIDINRQYITGLSMGGYGTWDVITRYPNRFAAAAPMSGAGDPSKVERFKQLPIWVFHNTNDQVVPVSGSRDMVKAMNNKNMPVVVTNDIPETGLKKQIRKKAVHLYTESPAGNHGPWEPWYNSPYLHQWLFQQSK